MSALVGVRISVTADGEALVLTEHGWAASFKDGVWKSGIHFDAYEMMENLVPVKDSEMAARLWFEAHNALGAFD